MVRLYPTAKRKSNRFLIAKFPVMQSKTILRRLVYCFHWSDSPRRTNVRNLIHAEKVHRHYCDNERADKDENRKRDNAVSRGIRVFGPMRCDARNVKHGPTIRTPQPKDQTDRTERRQVRDFHSANRAISQKNISPCLVFSVRGPLPILLHRI